MAKAKRGADRKMVGVRVPHDTWRIIQLAMVLRTEDTIQDLLLPAIQEFADRLVKEEPELKDMLRLAKENEARKGGVHADTDQSSEHTDS